MTIKGNGVIGFAVLVAAGLVAAGGGILAQGAAQQPEFKTLKADFIPGEKTIFFDDFTDMAPGDAPAHFKVRGAAPELKEAGAIRQLTFSTGGTIIPNVTALPNNFTFEAEAKHEGKYPVNTYLSFFSKTVETMTWIVKAGPTCDLIIAARTPKYEELGRTRLTLNTKDPIKLALWVQDGRVRAFVNGEKQLDFNQVALVTPIDRVELRVAPNGTGVSLGYRSMRFAESAPDFSQTILSSGRYVSHGILFDTNSDRIKPESAPAIQTIAKALGANPNLRLLIEGHTDSVGNAAANLDLSKRRAEAVKGVLVSQFAVDTARLTTAGLGATKPIDPNDTPQGRAQNRRVEFVKQ